MQVNSLPYFRTVQSPCRNFLKSFSNFFLHTSQKKKKKRALNSVPRRRTLQPTQSNPPLVVSIALRTMRCQVHLIPLQYISSQITSLQHQPIPQLSRARCSAHRTLAGQTCKSLSNSPGFAPALPLIPPNQPSTYPKWL